MILRIDPDDRILPPTLHTQHEDAVNAYKQYSRALLLHLQKDTTIIARKVPRATIPQQEQSMQECEFKLLFAIVKQLSQQLRGNCREIQ